MADYTVIGHIAVDRVFNAYEERVQIGGSPTYASLAVTEMGGAIEAITKIGSDIRDDHLSQLQRVGIDVREYIVEGATTTRFVLDYRVPERRLTVESICVDIPPEDVIDVSEAVLLSPIIGEIPQKTYSLIEADVLALDPQGFIRQVQPDGTIKHRAWFDEDLLHRTHIIKSSERELPYITQELDCLRSLKKLIRLGVEVAIATKGQEGATFMTERGAFDIPSVKDIAVRDPTGAGDVFLGCFFKMYLEGENPIWCSCMGSALASAVVETAGSHIEISSKKVNERAEGLYDRVVKV
ncbi:MAG TPA: PfkB family carbohydrate kinase [Patescibacteria group bacterium]|nr:PfkB family carbohydrate kinase [Patescibacteria group bacterium]